MPIKLEFVFTDRLENLALFMLTYISMWTRMTKEIPPIPKQTFMDKVMLLNIFTIFMTSFHLVAHQALWLVDNTKNEHDEINHYYRYLTEQKIDQVAFRL